ncbi:Golgin candidate 2 [Apostasia shenzhenica]|uniref:Golgin candidate 2 n=1 Tax=Apostasia shenzhenica TaxID=1088818 RepID=A0A2I0A0N2_9ASPA|nr:Golgin candidate 2 [Apostasia shenzhenica]
MAGWISSKLKVAENLLQQIDQQAAESLGKVDKPRRSPSAADLTNSSSSSKHSQPPFVVESSRPPPKFPLSKKPTPSQLSPGPGPPDLAKVPNHPSLSSSLSLKPTPDSAVIDWTELLSSPIPTVPATSPRSATGVGVPRLSPHRVVKKQANAKNGKVPSGRVASPSSSPSSSSAFSSVKQDRGDDNEPQQGQSENLRLRRGECRVITDDGMHERFEDVNGSRDNVAKEKTDLRSHVPEKLPSDSDKDSDPDTSSSAGSDSEEENRRREERKKRREQVLAENVAKAAAEAIKEREDLVTRLEVEKASLEKILEERERQQAKEASELQMNVIETMEAVELEKQKHNSTRMEALVRLAELEARNAELAKLLAAEQWNLEVELNRVAELKQEIGFNELALEEHRRRMSNVKQQSSSPGKLQSLGKDRVEREIIEAEYSFTCDKIAKLKDKTRRLEESIEQTKMELLQPTQVEVELKKRLAQLTDHLIQKQSQVEALSSEKGTLVFRMETISKILDENGLSMEDGEFESVDIETGTWQQSHSASKAALHERIRSGRQQICLVIRQLDAIFAAGVIFLRRNPMAQLLSILYLLCLHLWVLYILWSPSQISDGTGQGAVFSLETINNSSNH